MNKFIHNKGGFNRFVALISLLLTVPFLSAQESSAPANNQQNITSIIETTSPESIKFAVDDDFSLSGDFYSGDALGAGVLLLHDCSHSSKSYSVLGELLAKQGVNALALDFRGYGASTSELFSHQALKLKVKNIVSYQAEVAMLTSYWEKDVLYAYNYLRSRIGNEQPISIVASGCAVNEAIQLADKMRVNSFVILSPIMDYMEKEHYKNLIDIPAYFVSSAHHADSFLTAQELFSWNGDSRSTTQVFKGVNQGHSLLRRNKFLAQNLATWLRGTMN
jgi:alpha-beta hydrolase superfamily lysophospholipase